MPIWRRSRSRRTTRPFRCSTSRTAYLKNIGPARCRADCFLARRNPGGSKIQHQPFALAAGAADHDLGVGRLLLLGQDGVAVLGLAGYDALLAGAADAELAGII